MASRDRCVPGRKTICLRDCIGRRARLCQLVPGRLVGQHNTDLVAERALHGSLDLWLELGKRLQTEATAGHCDRNRPSTWARATESVSGVCSSCEIGSSWNTTSKASNGPGVCCFSVTVLLLKLIDDRLG